MSVFLRRKILYKDYSKIMDQQPVFNISVFANNCQNWVTDRDGVCLYQYIITRDFLDQIKTSCGDESTQTKVASLHLEGQIAVMIKSEKSRPEIQIRNLQDPIAAAAAIGKQNDFGSDDSDSSEDEEYRQLNLQQRKEFGIALKHDIKHYFASLKNVNDKFKWAHLLLRGLGLYSSRQRSKMFIPNRPPKPRIPIR